MVSITVSGGLLRDRIPNCAVYDPGFKLWCSTVRRVKRFIREQAKLCRVSKLTRGGNYRKRKDGGIPSAASANSTVNPCRAVVADARYQRWNSAQTLLDEFRRGKVRSGGYQSQPFQKNCAHWSGAPRCRTFHFADQDLSMAVTPLRPSATRRRRRMQIAFPIRSHPAKQMTVTGFRGFRPESW
jgi:hypothetical protein